MRLESKALDALERELRCWIILLWIINSDIDDTLDLEFVEFAVAVQRTVHLLFDLDH